MHFPQLSYPDLPSDFRDAHRSIWVDIDPRLFDATVVEDMYDIYLESLEHSATVGFDAVCVNEHHANAGAGVPSPNLIASMLARSTRDVAILVLGASLALYNPPLRVAEEFGMIDVVSGGRLIAGLPVGTPMDTCFAYGVDPSTLRARYYEAHDLLLQAWTCQQAFAFDGTYTKLRYANALPRPVQQPYPPIWIPSGGVSVDTWRWCATRGYVYCAMSYYGYKLGQATLNGYWDVLRSLGQEPNPFRAGFLQFVGVADSDSEAMDLYRDAMEYYHHRCLHVYSGFGDPPGYRTEASVRAAWDVSASSATSQRGQLVPFDEMVRRGSIIVGSPTTVTEKLVELATSLNVGNLMLALRFGNMQRDLGLHNIDLMAHKVLPELRPLFADEWEHQWWPSRAGALMSVAEG